MKPVQSVGRALDLLETLMCHDGLPLGELARSAGLQPSTAHRLLSTLVSRRYVVQERPSGHYALASRAQTIADGCELRVEPLRAAARPYLERACKVTGETANLVVLDEHAIVYLDQIEGRDRTRRMFMHVGMKVPAHTAAGGKALLATRAADEPALLSHLEPLAGLTERTITSVRRLSSDLSLVRRRGYAIDDQEHEPGVSCVAAPVFDDRGEAVGAISVSGPTARLHEIGLGDLGELLVILTGELSAQLSDAAQPISSAPAALRRRPRASG